MKFGSGLPETACGRGSTIKNTQEIREFLPKLIDDYKIESMLDLACGDCNWISSISLNCEYVGQDNDLEHLMKADKLMPDCVFDLADVEEISQPYDLIMARHVFQHLPTDKVVRTLDKMRERSKYYLVTSHNVPRNVKLPPSKFRPLNMGLEPFNLKPDLVLQDETLEMWFGAWR